jgi:hypothetical protein
MPSTVGRREEGPIQLMSRRDGIASGIGKDEVKTSVPSSEEENDANADAA